MSNVLIFLKILVLEKKKAIDQVIWEVAVQLNKNHICENELKSNCKLINFKLKFSNFRYWI